MDNKVTKHWLMIWGLVLALVLGLLRVSTAAELVVCPEGCKYSFIQTAIKAASPGDIILVSDGTYVENINFLGKAVTVQSVNGPERTTINGNGRGSVIVFASYEGVESVLDGFTVTNGSGTVKESDSYGGGIYCYNSSPTIKNCLITRNSATYFGGGIYAYYSSPTIEGCTIYKNRAVGANNLGFGGGLYFAYSSPNIVRSIISGNTAISSGGGIACGGNSFPLIIDCYINNNIAKEGGGIFCSDYNSSPIINNCVINGNRAFKIGGGIALSDNSTAKINACKISNNLASSGGGGAIAAKNDSQVQFTNCTINSNTAAGDGGAVICLNNTVPVFINCTISGNRTSGQGGAVAGSGGSIPIFINSILWGNSLGGSDEVYVASDSYIDIVYSNVEGSWPGEGNINANPLFVGKGDYHLKANSPCINSGTSDNVPADDIDGELRPMGKGYDMGSDEFRVMCTDADKDGFAVEGGACGAVDCDDTRKELNPESVEICDGVDNNCNGKIDEGVIITYYQDGDGDGFGDSAMFVEACQQPEGYVEDNTDCNDYDAGINPTVREVDMDKCTDGLDNDCNGVEDSDEPGCAKWF